VGEKEERPRCEGRGLEDAVLGRHQTKQSGGRSSTEKKAEPCKQGACLIT
jgi:hypothetical protein